MKHLVLTLWFVLFLSSSALAGVEYVTEEICRAPAGCWVNVKTGECPDCVMGRREVAHTHEEEPVIVEKETFVEPKRTFWPPKKTAKVEMRKSWGSIDPQEKETTKKGDWTCIVGPCDFIDENGNLIDES